MPVLIPVLGILLACYANAQIPATPALVPATPITPVPPVATTTTTPAVSEATAATNATAECAWDGSVTDYFKCQKQTLSTTTLIAAGLGVTVGILALVGLCVWLCNRKKRSRHPRSSEDEESKSTSKTMPRESPESSDDERMYNASHRNHNEKRRVRPDDDESSLEKERLTAPKGSEKQPPRQIRDPRAARVESSSSAEYAITPPPPHPAHVPKTQLPSEVLGSPMDDAPSRQLYPSNPSPMPRHLRAQPGTRASTHSRRQSIASARFVTEDVLPAPPLPAPVRSNTGTPPLTIRKSTIDGSSGRIGGGIPSYYEATRGQTATPARPTLSMYGRSGSAPEAPPLVPFGNRPPLESRRPSAPAAPQENPSEGPKRGSAERGGRI